MAITRAQQVKQMLKQGGRTGFFKAGLAQGDQISPGTDAVTGGPRRDTDDRQQIIDKIKRRQIEGPSTLEKIINNPFVKTASAVMNPPGFVIRQILDKQRKDEINRLFGVDPDTVDYNVSDVAFMDSIPKTVETFEGSDYQNLLPLVEEEEIANRTSPGIDVGNLRPQAGLSRRFAAEGGIMDLETGRQMYFLGKLVKKATRAVKKVADSPLGKIALIGGGLGLAGIGPLAGLRQTALGKGLAGFFGEGSFNPFKALTANVPGMEQLGKSLQPSKFASMIGKNPFGAITAVSALAGLLTPAQEAEAQRIADEAGIDIAEIRANPDKYLARAFKADGGRMEYVEAGAVMSKEDMEKMAKSPLYKGFKTMYGVSPDMAKDNKEYKDKFKQFEQLFKKGYQKGGDVEPVAKKTMPLLDMDGMEKDYRETGGFVDIGRMERADDVPARLSKNEFVFTADAVRNAGEGDIDKGAEVMYNMMKNLEAGGGVSEESQGLEGAREMFQTSQRLGEVV